MKAILAAGFLLIAAALMHGSVMNPESATVTAEKTVDDASQSAMNGELIARNTVCNPRVEVCEE